MNLQILEEASADVVIIYEWYESKRNGLGLDFELCLDEVFARITKTPEIYPEWYRNVRCALLTRFPYGIFYRIKDDSIYILAIFHMKRKPAKIKHGIRTRKL